MKPFPDIAETIKTLDLRFKSGNEVPVSRASITRDEWLSIRDAFNRLILIVKIEKALAEGYDPQPFEFEHDK